jgi:plastocyanin
MKRLISSEKRSVAGITLLAGLLMIACSCNKSSYNNLTGMTGGTGGTGGTGQPPANEVYIQGMAFYPAAISVTVGTTIKWTNKDAITHTVTSDTKIFDSGTIGGGATYSYTFSTAGIYPYHCSFHPSMMATVTVN